MGFVTRLRFTENGPTDLAGNVWTNYNMTFTKDGKFGGKSAYAYAGVYNAQGQGGFLYTKFNESMFRITGDFTVSFHWKQDVSAWGAFLSTGGANVSGLTWVGRETDSANTNTMQFAYNSFSTGPIPINGNIPDNNGKWRYITFTRCGDILYAFIDGILVKSCTGASGTFDLVGNDGNVYVGRGEYSYHPWSNFSGCLDDFCIINGSALWTSNFDVPVDYLSLSNVYDIKVNPRFVCEKQINLIKISAKAKNKNNIFVEYGLIANGSILSQLSIDMQRSIDISKLTYGDNIITIFTNEDDKAGFFILNKENLYALSISRNFNSKDDGYDMNNSYTDTGTIKLQIYLKKSDDGTSYYYDLNKYITSIGN